MLYIVSTSIGNIEDTTLRAVKTLCNADIILCEDTRTFGTYYQRIQKIFNLSNLSDQRILSFHKDNEFQRIPEIIDELKKGKDIALVSESGTPLISDPGQGLIKHVIKSNLPLTAIPGPTAFVNATLLSGFPTDSILFMGFLPKKQNQVVQLFKQLHINVSKHINPTIIFYESPFRINKTLEIISEILPDANIAIAREMTKKFEEVIRGSPKDLKDKKFKGEITIALKLI